MDKGLRKLDKRVEELAGQIEDLERRKSEAETRLEAVKTEIIGLMEAFKVALTDGGDILSLEERRKSLVDEKERLLLLVAGCGEKIEALEVEMSSAIEARNERFAGLSREWLEKEISVHQDLTGKLLATMKRLAAAHDLLRVAGRPEPFQEVLGNAARYFQETRIIELGNGFRPMDLQRENYLRKILPDKAVRDRVHLEMCT